MRKEAEPATSSDQRSEQDRGTTGGTLPQTTTARDTDLTGIFRQLNVRESAAPTSDEESEDQGKASGAATDILSTQIPARQSVDPGFTQLFQSLGAAAPPTELFPLESFSSGKGFQQPQTHTIQGDPRRSSSGEFTRLFERLDARSAQDSGGFDIGGHETSPMSHGAESGGGFTQLLRTLSNESLRESPIPGAPLGGSSMVQPPSEAPGEFTRILSRSALREANQRDPQNNLPVSHQQTLAANPQPPLPHFPSTEGQALSSTVSPSLQSPSPTQITSPAISNAPAASAQMPRSGKFQEYVPLLLIANLFAMLVVILLVALMLIHHR